MERVGELVKHFTTTPISWPTHWGGYRIAPEEVEFWQGRPSRLHDRVHYTLHPESGWQRVRLSP